MTHSAVREKLPNTKAATLLHGSRHCETRTLRFLIVTLALLLTLTQLAPLVVAEEPLKTSKINGAKLWQGKDTTITCRLKTNLNNDDEKRIVIKAIANYRYHYDTQTRVNIEPKR